MPHPDAVMAAPDEMLLLFASLCDTGTAGPVVSIADGNAVVEVARCTLAAGVAGDDTGPAALRVFKASSDRVSVAVSSRNASTFRSLMGGVAGCADTAGCGVATACAVEAGADVNGAAAATGAGNTLFDMLFRTTVPRLLDVSAVSTCNEGPTSATVDGTLSPPPPLLMPAPLFELAPTPGPEGRVLNGIAEARRCVASRAWGGLLNIADCRRSTGLDAFRTAVLSFFISAGAGALLVVAAAGVIEMIGAAGSGDTGSLPNCISRS